MESLKDVNATIQPLLLFAYKVIILLVLIGGFLIVMLPESSDLPDLSSAKLSLGKILKEEKTKVLMLSFIQNPDALYKLSEISEDNGCIRCSIRYVELGIGLLEMHGADRLAVKRYSDRVRKLKAAEGMQP